MIVHTELRSSIMLKMIPKTGYQNGSAARNLTNDEYHEITRMNSFPHLPIEARHIDYSFYYDGFLPDFSLSISYDLPLEMKIDTFTTKQGEFLEFRTTERKGDHQRVNYNISES